MHDYRSAADQIELLSMAIEYRQQIREVRDHGSSLCDRC
jgi:hypothetical protein